MEMSCQNFNLADMPFLPDGLSSQKERLVERVTRGEIPHGRAFTQTLVKKPARLHAAINPLDSQMNDDRHQALSVCPLVKFPYPAAQPAVRAAESASQVVV